MLLEISPAKWRPFWSLGDENKACRHTTCIAIRGVSHSGFPNEGYSIVGFHDWGSWKLAEITKEETPTLLMSPWRTERVTLWTYLLFMGIVSWNFQIFWYFLIPMQYWLLSYCYWSTLAISLWHKLICLYKTLFQWQYICYITFSGWYTYVYRNLLTHPIPSNSLFLCACVWYSLSPYTDAFYWYLRDTEDTKAQSTSHTRAKFTFYIISGFVSLA